MPMDGFTLSFMARELNEKLAGGRVDKVNQPERDALTLLIRSGGGNHRLLLSANANQARAQLTGQNYENPAEPPMFCMLMRKHLLGARVTRVEQLFGDRILAVRFDALDEMRDHVEKTLYLEVMGRYSDLTLVGQDGVIVDAIRHVNSEMSRVRTLLPGDEYQLPPRQEKLTPEEILKVNIPTGVPLVYTFDRDFNVVDKQYIGDPETIAAKIDAVANQGKAKK